MNDNQMVEIAKKIISLKNSASNTLGLMAKTWAKIIATEFMQGFSSALGNYVLEVQKAKDNPQSYFSYMKYEEGLNAMHWAWPYEIDAIELKSLLENAYDEKEFDKLMVKFFDKQKLEKLCEEIGVQLPEKHKIMFRQSRRAYDRGDFAIANNALISIIDNLLSEYLVNKGNNKRLGIFKPIIEYYEGFPIDEVEFIFELCMLSNNINFIFQDYNFDNKIDIKTHKKIRRHPSLHGVKYSNKKIDALLLFNTLVNLLMLKPYLKDFANSIQVKGKRKEFVFSDKKLKEIDEKEYEENVLIVLEEKQMAEHKVILQEIERRFPNTLNNTGKRLSRSLQKMKHTRRIESKKIEGKTFWGVCEIET